MGDSGDPRKQQRDDERNKSIPAKTVVPPPVLQGYVTAFQPRVVASQQLGALVGLQLAMGDLQALVHLEPGDVVVRLCEQLLLVNEQALIANGKGSRIIAAQPGDEQRVAAELQGLKGD
jgi:hypothetical protein